MSDDDAKRICFFRSSVILDPEGGLLVMVDQEGVHLVNSIVQR